MRKTALCLGLILSLSFLHSNARSDAFVTITIDGFSPSSVTIARHQYVWFTVSDDNGPYTVSSTKGYWTPWYLFDLGDGFGMQINENGTYNYYDAFNWNYGVIYVVETLPPPTLTIESPHEGTIYAAPASFTFGVSASDATSGVAKVQLYLGTNLLEELYSSPFSTTISGLGAGDYTLTAIAYNNIGGAATNSVHITVQGTIPPAIFLSSPRVTGNQLSFDVSGHIVGKAIVLQYATEMRADWTSIETNVTADAQVTFNQPILPGQRFFRAVQLP